MVHNLSHRPNRTILILKDPFLGTFRNQIVTTKVDQKVRLLLLLLGAELPLMVESFGLLNYLLPFPSIMDAGYPIFNLHLGNILFDVILPSVLGSSL